jgi:acyl-CoA thioester hydrolase
MARVKLSIPEHTIFTTDIAVRITDINYGNHLGNDALVSILQEARMQWLTSNNYTELNIFLWRYTKHCHFYWRNNKNKF